jgi:DNA repair exonuclease SbcCD ATPase subunit
MENTQNNLPAVTTLQELIQKSGISNDTGAMIYNEFAPLASSIADLATKAHAITVSDATQLTEMRQARAIRLALVKDRGEVDRKKDALKADALLYGKVVQDARNALHTISKTAEAHAEQQEKFAQIQEEKRQAEIRAARQDKLSQYQAFLPPMGDLGTMTAEEFAVVVDMAKAQKQKREEQEAQERKEAQEKEEADRLERERLKLAAQEAEAKRKEADEALAKERAALAAERAERERVEAAHRKAQEDVAKERAEMERKRRDAEEAQRREQEDKRKAEEAERLKAEALQKAQEAAPDREKLMAFAQQILNTKMPTLTTERGNEILQDVGALLVKVSNHIKTKAAAL